METSDRESSASEAPPSAARSWYEALQVYLRPNVLIVMFLGFSAGLPLALSGGTLAIWMAESGVDLKTIGLFTAVGTPYTIKFLWAPLVDATHVPVLSKWLGRRRGWLLLTQILLAFAIVFLGFQNPVNAPWMVALGALLVATASATQDIVIDAYRVEKLDISEQAAGMASYVAAYRIGMLVSSAGVLFLVSALERSGFARAQIWSVAYLIMAVLVGIGILTTLLSQEPGGARTEQNPQTALDVSAAPPLNLLQRVWHTALTAFRDLLGRQLAWAFLGFVVLFKLTDSFSGAMIGPFVIKLGFTRDDYAAIVKGVGLIATLAGGFAGGYLARALPITQCLWIGGIVQALANLTFSMQALLGVNHAMLIFAITAENFTSAIGTVIFIAYLSSLCQNPLHTATQYALLTALSAVGRTFLPTPSGYIAEWVGWPMFFVIACLIAIPSFILLAFLQRNGHFSEQKQE